MFSKIITLLAALALADSVFAEVCYSDTKYSLSMFDLVTNQALPLYALDNGPVGSIILVTDPKIAGVPGTTIYESGVSPNTNLNVEITDMSGEPHSAQSGIFHLSVMDMGERHGDATSVLGSKQYDWPHWTTDVERVWPEQTSAAQVFFACDVTVNSLKYTALSWGLAASDGSMPTGCMGTIVGKKYDVQVPC